MDETTDQRTPQNRETLVSTIFYRVHQRPWREAFVRIRKAKEESLESEFNNILGMYRSKMVFAYQRFGPFLALYRATIISFQVAKLTVWHFFVQDIHTRAVKVWLQLETLVAKKGRLAHENSVYARGNRFLREIVEYHQLTMKVARKI